MIVKYQTNKKINFFESLYQNDTVDRIKNVLRIGIHDKNSDYIVGLEMNYKEAKELINIIGRNLSELEKQEKIKL